MAKQEPFLKRIFFSIYSYTVIYALFGVVSLSYHACFNSSLSTLEKRYHFSSSTGGLIMITDNIANILTNLFIGYYGKTAHKPRWMAIGSTITGISVLLTSLPFFIYGPAQGTDLEFAKNMTLTKHAATIKAQNDQMCLSESIKEDCSLDTASDKHIMTVVAVSCFAISNFFRGFGTSIYFTYGMPYLDDNISKAKMPLFFGFMFAARIFGAPFGFAMSSLFLKYYEDPFSITSNDMTPNDPRWIGAWWIGFIISGSLMILLAIPLAFFPREFRKKIGIKNNKNNNTNGYVITQEDSYLLVDQSNTSTKLNNDNQNLDISTVEQQRLQLDLSSPPPLPVQNATITTTTTSPPNGSQIRIIAPTKNSVDDNNKINTKKVEDLTLRELPREILNIITNPLIVCQMLGNTFRGIGMIGFFVFQTKFLESQFNESASKASLTSGTTGFLGKVFGIILGGAVITLFRPGPRKLTTFIFLVECTSIFALLFGATIQGPQYNYPETEIFSNGQLNLTNQCNFNCHCENLRYQPVCEHDNTKAYFSPCHAGCKNSFKSADGSGTTTFTECSCILDNSKTLEKCPPDTSSLMKYAYVIAIGSMISGSSRAGNMVTFFRSINPDQKPLAVAVIGFWHSLAVSIPYPIIYGALFDFCCIIWSRECNKRGNCWLYDTNKLRYVYHGLSIALVVLGSIFDLIMIFLSPRLGNLYDDEDLDSTFKDRLMFWRKKTTTTKKDAQIVPAIDPEDI